MTATQAASAAVRDRPRAGQIRLLPASYGRLPETFYARLAPVPVAEPRLVRFNTALAAELGLDAGALSPETLAAVFAGNVLPAGAEPLAMAYAGHQFGYFVPQLGDGRALLLGELRDVYGELREIQLKGSGRTPFSRDGDGRAALGPVLREYLVSEAMHALGIPSTRSLAAVLTGEIVQRERPLPGAIVTRVAASHVRVGTFQYFAARGHNESVRLLADDVIGRHYPEARAAERPHLALLQAVSGRQARLIAHWMHVGFIHGVMNTDNMSVAGETIDFGPCAFMDAYDPATVFSSIDSFGRYRFENQPLVAQWNLARLAETLLPLIDPETERAVTLASEAIAQFETEYQAHWLAGMRAKLGLPGAEEGDRELVQGWLAALHRGGADFTLAHRALTGAAAAGGAAMAPAWAALRALFTDPSAFDAWAPAWRARAARGSGEPEAPLEAMRRSNPCFIPRNHRVQQAIDAAVERRDFSRFEELLAVLARPYAEQPSFAAYRQPPLPSERVLQTFCGT
jgi:uncharacterized protein YdiU (UPF0061 family)